MSSLTNRDKRQLTMIIGYLMILVTLVSGAIAFLDVESRRGALTFMVCFDVGLTLWVAVYLLAHKLFPESESRAIDLRDITNDKD